MYPAVFIDKVFEKSFQKSFISIFDCQDAYWQVITPPEYWDMCAFSVAQGKFRGHYVFNGLW